MELTQALHTLPLVAILRGVQADEVEAVAEAVYAAGIRIIEVPLNSPVPFDSIARLQKLLGDRCLCGAGTVLTVADVDRVAAAGGRLIVTPNTDSAVIQRAITLNLTVMPGFATASEAFQAYAAGARYLKLFPAGTYGTGHLSALTAVLPADAKVLAVGGVSADNAQRWLQAGAIGLGMGSELYRAGDSVAEVSRKAENLVQALRSSMPSS
ncbi:MAG: 2-dehydro-3-deoxy-6-phosphogalactonate aldolase [Pseudomonadales bacterium]|nr:2-dehydro-3-deoxy-6-phosphogalactonate aldolase [Pseudomonadales bacterium]